jgi:hypothetical protein
MLPEGDGHSGPTYAFRHRDFMGELLLKGAFHDQHLAMLGEHIHWAGVFGLVPGSKGPLGAKG